MFLHGINNYTLMAVISRPKRKILLELGKGSKHGYEIAKSTGLPIGSIYDHLSELVEEGYVTYREEGRRKIYDLTEKGRRLLDVLRL